MATENFTTPRPIGLSQSASPDMDELDKMIMELVCSLNKDQCKAAIELFKPIARKVREESGSVGQLLADAESRLMDLTF